MTIGQSSSSLCMSFNVQHHTVQSLTFDDSFFKITKRNQTHAVLSKYCLL